MEGPGVVALDLAASFLGVVSGGLLLVAALNARPFHKLVDQMATASEGGKGLANAVENFADRRLKQIAVMEGKFLPWGMGLLLLSFVLDLLKHWKVATDFIGGFL